MRCNTHLTFNGECKEAFGLYEKVLSGKVALMMTYRESPMVHQVPAHWADKIIHAALTFGDQELTGADTPPGGYKRPQGFSIMLHIDGVEDAERIFSTLAKNGVVEMPLQETFWASRFGMAVDRFGTPWSINCGKPARLTSTGAA